MSATFPRESMAILLSLGIGVSVTFCTVIIQALTVMPMIYFVRYELRLGRVGVRFGKDVAIVAGATLVALAAHLVAIATWAMVFMSFGQFSGFADAVYFSGLNYTTLGDTGGISPSWRFLVPLVGANGTLMFGVTTAMLFALVQRLTQTRLSERRKAA